MANVSGIITAIPAPEGYILNFDQPARNGNMAIYFTATVGMIFALLCLAQRLYVSVVVRRRFGVDDVLLILAWIFSVVIQAFIIRGAAKVFIGVHAWEIPATRFAEFVRYSVYLNPIVYSVPCTLSKMVILIFYLQLQNQHKFFTWSIYTTMFINIGSGVGIFFSSIFSCSPIAMGWDMSITTGKCIDRVALFTATAALGVITDILIILIPIPMVLGLHMSTRKKAGLLVLFSIGSATVITSVIRLYLLMTALGEVDQPWGAGPISAWICVEANLLIVCASMPTLRQFFRHVSPGLMSLSGKTLNSESGSQSRTARSQARSQSRAMQGFGAGNGRRGYVDFDGTDTLCMETRVTATQIEKDVNSEKGYLGETRTPSEIEIATEIANKDWNDGGESDKRIIQTKTTRIAYEEV